MHALSVDPATREPFLRLPEPHHHIILTPPRPQDAPHVVRILNDPVVYCTIEGPPHPYLLAHANHWLAQVTPPAQQVWSDIQRAHAGAKFACSPVRIIRELHDDGSQSFLGDCVIDRWGFRDIADSEQRSRATAQNNQRSVGDPHIIWTLGDYLAASHHGKGIMTAVIRCLLEQWAIPFMNVRHIKATVFQGNIGSLRVFEKNAFATTSVLQGATGRGDSVTDLMVVEWSSKDMPQTTTENHL